MRTFREQHPLSVRLLAEVVSQVPAADEHFRPRGQSWSKNYLGNSDLLDLAMVANTPVDCGLLSVESASFILPPGIDLSWLAALQTFLKQSFRTLMYFKIDDTI